MSKIDKVIQAIRSDLSGIATDHDKGDSDLYRFVGVENSRSYNFVLDAFYLLEDTQLAKASFRNADFQNIDFGTLYLLYYGLLNACYMQQQAILVLCRELGVTDGLEPIKTAEIVSFRNSFSAHSPNRGRGDDQHSFILDRHAMRIGRVEGYSSNHASGHFYLQANIFQLLNDWDESHEEVFELIGKRVYGDQLCQKI
ncbi:hypothetical protein [Vreelandella titanicae]|uniref:hypothetical protein n=1 Tax=Vreelandella titanicae TaxID=664683 RepID=UPI00168018A5|nr:hypothetical protein [Halomonas titanicae]QNU61069.1 hypothetical protein HZS52_14885 [Halomonas titanicae]